MPQPGQHAVRVSRGLVAADGVLIVGSMTEVDAARPGTSTVPGALWASEVTKDPSGHGLRHVHATTEALRYSGCWPLRMGRPMWSDRQVGGAPGGDDESSDMAPAQGAIRHIYQVTDRLHDGRTARVPGDEITSTVSGWLSELGTQSPLADELARAVRIGDWPAAYAIGEHLSVEIAVAV